MSCYKKILITLPEQLLEEADSFAKKQGKNRSELVREAIKMHVKELKRLEVRDKLIRGYQEMAAINSEWAEAAERADYEALVGYEEKLAECEKA